MPRNVSDIYYIPPGTEGFPDTTIESEKYNNYIHDVETDLNRPRPISSGGTGASDADEALANLGAEKSSQKVDNYDTHAFFPGSFYSATNATGAPITGHAFVGWSISSDIPASPPVNANVIIHAKDQSDTAVPSALYVREKKANVWGPWRIIAPIVANTIPPITPPDNTLYWNNEDGFLYIYYNDGNTKQWVMVSPQPYTGHFAIKNDSVQKIGDTMTGHLVLPTGPADDNAVRKDYVDDLKDYVDGLFGEMDTTVNGLVSYNDPQTPTIAQQAQARNNIYAAPYDAMAYSNMLVNAAFDAKQFGNSATITPPWTYFCDMWEAASLGTMAATVSAYNVLALFPMNNICEVVTTTAQASLGSLDYVALRQKMEADRIVRLCWGTSIAQPLTVSFWCAHGAVGNYTVHLNNGKSGAASRTCCVGYTQNVSQAPEFKVVTFPGCFDGTWDIGNDFGLVLFFTVACGPGYITPTPGVWTNVNHIGVPGQVNGAQSTANRFRISGVTALAGTEALTADRSALIMRPYPLELMICQRYYEVAYGSYRLTSGAGGAQAGTHSTFIVSKRITPTCTFLGGGTANNTSFQGFPAVSPSGVGVQFNHAGGFDGYHYGFAIRADARM